MDSSAWIDDILSPARTVSRENYTTLHKIITDSARGCRDAGGTEERALAFVYGMFYASWPHMWPLFQGWIHEVYMEEA